MENSQDEQPAGTNGVVAAQPSPRRPKRLGLFLWLRVWISVVRQAGLRAALRSARNQLEERLVGDDARKLLAYLRAWYALGLLAGAAALWLAAPPRMNGPAVDVSSLLAFASFAGAGAALVLRSLAMLLSTFSGNLLVHRFQVSMRPTLIRAAALAGIAAVAWQLPWPVSGWTALVLAAVAWAVWPLVVHAVVAAKAPRHITHRLLSVDQLLAMSARRLPPESRAQIALHEAGHAVFFGLGNCVPEDLYAWMDDEIPAVDEASPRQHLPAGAVSSFAALAEKTVALDLRRVELHALLGMTCGGAAAEILETGHASAGMVQDTAAFEGSARLYLALYPDPRWPFVQQPQGDGETRVNAQSLGGFREHMLASAVEFLRANRPRLHRVRDALLAKGELDVEDLRRLTAGTVAAAGFAGFDWPKDMPAMPYLDEAPAGAPAAA